MDLLDLTGKTILITGASSGIGRETAVLLSGLGARVILSGRDPKKLAATLEAMKGAGHRSEPFELGELEKIPEWMTRVASEHGPLDGMVHSAGVRRTAGLRAVTVAAWESTLRVNLSAAAMLVKGFRQKNCRTATSSVVLIGSVAGMRGSPGISAYAASKAGLEGLSKALAIELAREGIRVNCIAPGMVESEMAEQIRSSLTEEQNQAIAARHPLGIGSAADVAQAAAFLLSAAARWITGTTLVVDGGYSAQ